VHRCQGGQYPPQTGAVAAPHDGRSGVHVQAPAAPGRQTFPAGQKPLQAGAATVEQLTVGGAHTHALPPDPTTHSAPSGQTPAQSGAAAEPQATTSGSQRQAVPVALGRQACPAGQSPPHDGAAELPHD